jgi:tRNA A37 methylthiotransferase MiaB
MMIGKQEEILISWKGRNEGWVGRTRNFKEVFIPVTSHIEVGQVVRVKILSLEWWNLQWEVIK